MGIAIRNIDRMSAAGVTTALKRTIATTTMRQLRAIAAADTTPSRLSITTNTGSTKATPVASTILRMKST